jgi:hypothetical protein
MDKKCEICGTLEMDGRGLICDECNYGLGWLNWSPYTILSALKFCISNKLVKWDITNHPTQEQSPEQCQEFVKILSDMWQTHLDKNHDYSPANILLTGTTGLVTRIWDKTARLLNLNGFKFKAILHEGVNPPKNPKNESIEDTYRDLTVYGVIGILLLRNKWGK